VAIRNKSTHFENLQCATQPISAFVWRCETWHLTALVHPPRGAGPCSSSASEIPRFFALLALSAVVGQLSNFHLRSWSACLSKVTQREMSIKKPTPKGRVRSRLVAFRPHLLSLTTLPGEAGWYRSTLCPDALVILGPSSRLVKPSCIGVHQPYESATFSGLSVPKASKTLCACRSIRRIASALAVPASNAVAFFEKRALAASRVLQLCYIGKKLR